MKKFIRIIAAAMAAFFCLQIVAFSEGEPSNDGVRVTIVDAETGAVKSASIDYTNTNASDIALHFGKVSKAEYVGGTALSATTSSYTFINPTEPLPTIISDGSGASIEEIRSYFTD